MAIRYYDDALAAKLNKWMPDTNTLRVLKPDETKRLFETRADDKKDAPIQLPLIALSRSNDIELLSNIKSQKSFDGLTLASVPEGTLQFNVIPIKVQYQLDIYAKKYEQADEYLRNFLFKLINNPLIKIDIPYNSDKVEAIDQEACIKHVANIRVLDTVSDTSDITEHLFEGQFTRWTIQMEIQDAFLFNIPYKKNWKIYVDAAEAYTQEEIESMSANDKKLIKTMGAIEVVNNINDDGEIERIL